MVAQLRGKPGGADLPVAIGDFAGVSAPGGPYGLIYVVFNTFLMLTTQDDQVRCFARVAANLLPGRRVRDGGVRARPDPVRRGAAGPG